MRRPERALTAPAAGKVTADGARESLQLGRVDHLTNLTSLQLGRFDPLKRARPAVGLALGTVALGTGALEL